MRVGVGEDTRERSAETGSTGQRRPAAGLALVDGLAAELDRYHLLHAVRADLLRRLGRDEAAARAYAAAIERTANAAEQEFLRGRRAALAARSGLS